ncbi:MAG: NUDIX domain-containing protein [Ezakiella sp.]|nr:NUDIX domain-containing protein [Ezakiella sp.]
MRINKKYTIIYIKDRDSDKFLFLYRNKKKNDSNHGKYIGFGGKIEEGESPEECIAREVNEELGIKLIDYQYRGLVSYIYLDENYKDLMYVYTGTSYEGEPISTTEGELAIISESELYSLPHWKSDELFIGKALNFIDFGEIEIYFDDGKLLSYSFK